MRYSGTWGYQGYRGRRSGGKRWLILILVLILLAASAFLIAQRYMVYDMDGSFHFELPWFRHAENGSVQQPTARPGRRQDLEIIIEQPPLVEAAYQELHAVELDTAALQGGASRALSALPENVNAVAIRLKTVDGDLLYPSALAEAAEARAVAGGSIARSSIEELTGAGCYTIARLAALHDSRFSLAHKADAAIQQKKYKNEVWYAPDNSFYLAPEKELTRQYLVNIAAEVASLGFNELLFDEFAYPTVGRLNNIKTAEREMSMEDALSLLADNLRETLLDTNVRLSVVMDEKTVLRGSDTKSGQVLADLAARFDRIYVPTTEEQLPALQEALAPYPAELVPILESAPAVGVYLIPTAQESS